MNGLVSVLALPDSWSGDEPIQILSGLLDALLRVLSPDFVYARLRPPYHDAPVEMVNTAPSSTLRDKSKEIGKVMSQWRAAEDAVKFLRPISFVSTRQENVPVRLRHAVHDSEARLECLGAAQDMTQRRRAEEDVARSRSELASAMRAASLGALTASIAHQVSQPLSGIIPTQAHAYACWIANRRTSMGHVRRRAAQFATEIEPPM